MSQKKFEYVFKRRDVNYNEFTFSPESTQTNFYQVCIHPFNKKYQIRKITYNQNFEVINIKDLYYDKLKMNALVKALKPQKYMLISQSTLKDVPLPSNCQIQTSQSELFSDVGGFNGFAKF